MAKNPDPKWIEHMHMKKGALTKKANAAGQSPMGFAQQNQNAPGATGAESRLATVLNGLHKK